MKKNKYRKSQEYVSYKYPHEVTLYDMEKIERRIVISLSKDGSEYTVIKDTDNKLNGEIIDYFERGSWESDNNFMVLKVKE